MAEFRIKTEEFGFEMYIAPGGVGETNVTDKKEEATVFDNMIDDPSDDAPRLKFFRAITGIKTWRWEKV